jgi:hypothetical protein
MACRAARRQHHFVANVFSLEIEHPVPLRCLFKSRWLRLKPPESIGVEHWFWHNIDQALQPVHLVHRICHFFRC